MEHIRTQEQFSAAAAAAPSIFSYVKANPVLQRHRLAFEYGMVDKPSARAIAKFVCHSCATCSNAVIWVAALTRLDGTWSLSHTIGSVE